MMNKFHMNGDLLAKLAQSEIKFKKFNQSFVVKWSIYVLSISTVLIAAYFIDNVFILRFVGISALVAITITTLWHRKVVRNHFESVLKDIEIDQN